MNVAIVGATGVVGEMIRTVLDERRIPVDRFGAFASRDHAEGIVFRGASVPVRAATPEALAGGWDAVFFASSEDASAALAPACLRGGAVVIDNSSTFRADPAIPLVVPEVNPQAVGPNDRVFPVANCTAIVLVVALAPILRAAGLAAVRVATYQAVSGAGRAGLDELAAGESALFAGREEPQPKAFVAPIARNVIPQIGSFDANGDSGEETKVVAETRKILGAPNLRMLATTVRVPVRCAHSEAVFFETGRDTTAAELAAALRAAPGIVYHEAGVVTPREVEGHDEVHVARLRAEPGSRRSFQMWVVGDQVRKGAATNAVQILQLLLERGLVPAKGSVETSAAS
jgi:aspartate-semialdehyde dehydrogenase